MRAQPVVALLLASALGGCARGAPPMPMSSSSSSITRGTFRSDLGSREFIVHAPARATPPRAGDGALVVVLHGCTQDAADIARGTRLDEWSDRDGFTVLYPEQPANANPKKCWNWYEPRETTRGAGEVELLAALIDSVAKRGAVPPQRIALVGMSAGAAMAASLAIAYPTRYGALVMHSGVPAGVAHDVPTALAVMQHGVADAVALGVATHARMGNDARAIAVLLMHGGADVVVSPTNLEAIARQWIVANAASANVPVPAEVELATPRVASTASHAMSGKRVRDARGNPGVEWWRIDGVGHAWSGGSTLGTFTAPGGPDASAMLVSFLQDVWTAH